MESDWNMSHRSAIWLALVAGSLAGSAAAQGTNPPKPQMQAREFFYFGASEAGKAASKPPTGKGGNAPGTKGTKGPTSAGSKAPANGAKGPSASPGGISPPAPGSGPTAPDGTPVILAAAGPLGLKYTILKRAGSQRLEVADDAVFHTGDKIQVKVETNGPGYLYIVTQGPSGTWKPMFPSAEISGGSNRVEGGKTVTLPSEDYGMTFVEPAGTENIMIVLSRQPVPDFEELIYSLRDKAKPAAQPAEPKAPGTYLVADARIGDPTVEQLRRLYSRDLIIEKVTPETPGEQKETAVYVVNPAGGTESRLVADIHLVHQ